MRGGALPGAVVAACVGGVLVWTMAAHDPYWRLFEADSLPAPDYESPAEIEAALAAAVVVARPADSSAMRPKIPAEPKAGSSGPAMALAPRAADPLIAVPVSLAGSPDSEVASGTVPTRQEETPAPGAEPAPSAPTIALAPPPLFQPDVGAGALPESSVLDPVSLAAAPSPLWVAADEASENVLALTRAQRADVQRRLALAGFDPQGFDGVFGPRTRQAISDFQAAWGFPESGYLDSAVHADLQARTEEAYAALASRAATEPRAAPKLAPVAREREFAANDSGGCTRGADGQIIERQSFGCDLKGLAEKVVSLGRTKLAHEEADTFAAGGVDVAVTTGAQR